MKFFTKTVLAAAVVGALASGNAMAAAQINVDDLVFAKEIVTPVELTVPVSWNLGYNFNENELRYACIKLDGATPVASTIVPTVTNADITVGAVNVSNNVAFFTLTYTGAAGTPTQDDEVEIAALQFEVENQSTNVFGTVGLYDNPAAAGACNNTNPQLIPGTGDTEKLISWAPSFQFVTDPNKAIASVESDPSFTQFTTINNVSTASTANLAYAELSLVPETRLKADGTAITLADIFPIAADLDIAGDFGDWNTSTEFDAAAAAINTAGDLASWVVNPSVGFDGNFVVENGGVDPDTGLPYEIPNSIYAASLTVTPNVGYDLGAGDNEEVTLTPTIDESIVAGDNAVENAAANAGQIVQDGVRLQTPLVQLAGADWRARMAISNTGSKDRTFTLRAYAEEGNSVTTPAATYTVKAGTTYVIEDLATVLNYTGRARGTVVAVVAGPQEEIKGVYQIVNTSANTISNINLINQNGGTGH
ncbi:hypothetical protein [Xanthomonas sp. XNM01]|uniref:hypothetical protein n=1 Tax=Xanthomonas sp. XNM01 TaxID=2769289 RepID=UPI001784488B|nr:hypothetical protein [Xanthomonas sp. XNM01]MBD9369570.1 hypothetical protein [Xanthomonas sp. XNM01]